MPQILVWQCPETEEIFINKSEYIEHIKELAWCRFCECKARKLDTEISILLHDFSKTATTYSEINSFANMHATKLVHLMYWLSYTSPRTREINDVNIEITANIITQSYSEYPVVACNIHASLNEGGITKYGLPRVIATALKLGEIGSMYTGTYARSDFYPLMHRDADAEYAKQRTAWKEDVEAHKIVSALEGRSRQFPAFRFKTVVLQ